MSGKGKQRHKMHMKHSGFLHNKLLERVWIEGTMRMKPLEDGMVEEVLEAFSARYPEEGTLLTKENIKRIFRKLRPARVVDNGETSLVGELIYSEPLKRHVSLFSLQQKARLLLDALAEAASDESFVQIANDTTRGFGNISDLHATFVDWCSGYGEDILSANTTRLALQSALERLHKIGPVSTDKQSVAIKEVSQKIMRKQNSFLRKAKELVRLQDEHTTRQEAVGRNCFNEKGSNATEIQREDTRSEVVKDLQIEIAAMELALRAAYEKQWTLTNQTPRAVSEKKTKFMAFFLLPNGKVKHFSIGLENMKDGDQEACMLMMAKHGYATSLKGRVIKHYASK